MQLREGYKQTEVGDIPKDWNVDSLSSVTPINGRNGIVDGPFGSNLKTIHYRKSGIPIVTSGFVTEGYFYADSYIYVDKEKFENEKRSAVQAGDIVMAKIGARCGASAIVPEWHQVSILSGNALKITIDQSRHSTFYIWQVLWSLYSRGRMEALRTVGAQPAISMAQLKQYKIPLPPFAEQRLISAALSDVDALLASQDKLIIKKCAIKQATMQQLLTGKKRLQGFTDEWEVRYLGDIADVLKGRGLSKDKVSRSGSKKCLLYGELFTTYSRVITDVVSSTDSCEGTLSINGDVLLPGSTTTTGIDLATASVLLFNNVLLGGDINIIRAKGDFYSSTFLAYLLTEEMKHKIAEMAQGTTIIHLYGKSLLKLELCLPTIKEQIAIATILSDMDEELTTLEKQRDKTSAIKQGMMQELLTGRIRLV